MPTSPYSWALLKPTPGPGYSGPVSIEVSRVHRVIFRQLITLAGFVPGSECVPPWTGIYLSKNFMTEWTVTARTAWAIEVVNGMCFGHTDTQF